MSQAKERPILFSGPMVRAILEGRKTVTRRPIKPSMRGFDVSFELHQQDDGSWRPIHTFDESCMDDQGTEHPVICPYGTPGDRLWVRETWNSSADCRPTIEEPFIYAADQKWAAKWKPSIHMPRIASRILLEVTDVRVERLQDISDNQARAEGYPALREAETGGSDMDAWLWFRTLWDEINGPEAFADNPWVWVVEFKRIEP